MGVYFYIDNWLKSKAELLAMGTPATDAYGNQYPSDYTTVVNELNTAKTDYYNYFSETWDLTATAFYWNLTNRLFGWRDGTRRYTIRWTWSTWTMAYENPS